MRLPANRRDFLRLTGAATLVSAGVSSAGTAMGRSLQSVSTQTTASDWQQVTKLAASDGDSEDHFGESVGIDGDTALIGAPNDEDPNGDSAGSAYVFRRSNGSWSQEAKLTASDGDSDDYFGFVGIDGDTALIGALGDENPNAEDAGSAYVFRRSNGSWSQEAKLTASDGDGGDRFGGSVEIDGDTALISDVFDDNPNGSDAGSAYAFRRSNGSWSEEAKLAANDGDSDDFFGGSVGLDGDTALIGADFDEDPNGVEAGSAYVFRRSNGSWSQEAKLAPSDGGSDDRFGGSVGIDGDTALIGARSDDHPNETRAGSAYVFRRSSGSWSQEAKLTASDGDDRDYFGESVGIDGDTALIEASGDDDPNGEFAGSAYVFRRSNGEWSEEAKLTANDGDRGDQFGRSVGIDGDTALIGARYDEDPNGEFAGSAYVFEAGFGATVYYQIDFVQGEPIENLDWPDGTYTNDQLIRFAHGSTEEAITRRSEGEFTTDEVLAERIDSQGIEVENGTASVTFTVADGESVTLSLASYIKPDPTWDPEDEDDQVFVDAQTETYESGTHTLTVELPSQGATSGDDEPDNDN